LFQKRLHAGNDEVPSVKSPGETHLKLRACKPCKQKLRTIFLRITTITDKSIIKAKLNTFISGFIAYIRVTKLK